MQTQGELIIEKDKLFFESNNWIWMLLSEFQKNPKNNIPKKIDDKVIKVISLRLVLMPYAEDSLFNEMAFIMCGATKEETEEILSSESNFDLMQFIMSLFGDLLLMTYRETCRTIRKLNASQYKNKFSADVEDKEFERGIKIQEKIDYFLDKMLLMKEKLHIMPVYTQVIKKSKSPFHSAKINE